MFNRRNNLCRAMFIKNVLKSYFKCFLYDWHIISGHKVKYLFTTNAFLKSFKKIILTKIAINFYVIR